MRPSSTTVITTIALFIVIAVAAGFFINNYQTPSVIKHTPEIGVVEERLSVSGTVSDAKHITLSFLQPDFLEKIYVQEGDLVKTGSPLAAQVKTSLEADRQAAVANAKALEAVYKETVEGVTEETSAVALTNIEAAQKQLENTILTEAAKIQQAKQKLFSTDLQTTADDKDIIATAPTVSGSYTCTNSGVYHLELYRSNSSSGYSYKSSGLEDGVFTAHTEKPGPLGDCGLYLQFDEDSRYHNTTWTISIPNKNSSQYSTLEAGYQLAQAQASSAIAAAEAALSLRIREAALTNASPRATAIDKAWQNFKQAEAQIQKVQAELNKRTLISPIAGTVAKHNFQVGVLTQNKEIILIPESPYVVDAYIPERYINNINYEQAARIVFDAASHTTFSAKVTDISPIPTLINGVTYYAITLSLDNYPDWLRAGMNADIDIITNTTSEYLRIPQRYIWYEDDQAHVLLESNNGTIATTSVTEQLRGTDGYTAVTGLTKDSVLITP